MKIPILIFYSTFCLLYCAFSQTPGEWTWMKGANYAGQWGVYGTQGIPDPANVPGGRYESGGMRDSLNNFWLFGGSGYDYRGNLGLLNDLWKYNPATNNWTFMKGDSITGIQSVFGTRGVPAIGNKPGGSYAFVTWPQVNGALWLFGGGSYNDLWRYDIATNEWTWMTGSNTSGGVGVYGIRGVAAATNTPGQRSEVTASWVDANGRLWMFGGGGYAATTTYGYLNDLWMYDPNTNMWTWESGDNFVNATGVYGSLGVPSPTNKPGGRYVYNSWVDLQNNLWLFGGCTSYYFNDLWKYDISSNQWTWMSGANGGIAGNGGGLYGTKCTGDSLQTPSRRLENKAGWVDGCGNFWLYGGFNILGDLWCYSPNNHKWTWVSGDTVTNSTPVWGTQGVSNSANKPGGRYGAPSFRHSDGSLWIFGGAYGSSPRDNALWRYIIDSTCIPTCGVSNRPSAMFQSSDTAFCTETGRCISFYDQSTGSPTGWQWTFAGAAPDTSSRQNPDSICYNAPGTYPVTLIVTNSNGSDTLTVNPLIIVASPPLPPTVTVTGGDSLFSSHATAYQWYLNGSPIAGATDSFYVAMQNGTYAVRGTDGMGCSSISNGVIILSIMNTELSGVNVYPNPVTNELVIGNLLSAEKISISITNILAQEVIALNAEIYNPKSEINIDVSKLDNGIYFLSIKTQKSFTNRKVIIER